MHYKIFFLRLIAISLLLGSLSFPATAFVLGNEEDLASLNPQTITENEGTNTAPIAQNASLSTYENIPIEGRLSAYDPQGDMLTYRILKNPARGSITMEEGSNVFTYSPYENKTGKDSFTFVAEDSAGNISASATISIVIEKNKTGVFYVDMTDSSAHKAAIELAAADVLVGERIGDQYFFHPDDTLSREEFLSLAMETLNVSTFEDVSATGFYDDEAIATWAKPYVASAVYEEILEGSEDEIGIKTFNPKDDITGEEATVMLNRLLSLSNVSQTSESTWSSQAVANTTAVGILTADTVLSQTLTKAEAATMLSGALEVVAQREASQSVFSFLWE